MPLGLCKIVSVLYFRLFSLLHEFIFALPHIVNWIISIFALFRVPSNTSIISQGSSQSHTSSDHHLNLHGGPVGPYRSLSKCGSPSSPIYSVQVWPLHNPFLFGYFRVNKQAFFDISKITQGGSRENSSNFLPKTQASLLKTQ